MQITCSCCDNHRKFLVPLWCRVTFKFTDEGTIQILHIKQLESLEEKLANQNSFPTLHCSDCGSDANIEFNEYESMDNEKRELVALGDL